MEKNNSTFVCMDSVLHQLKALIFAVMFCYIMKFAGPSVTFYILGYAYC